MHSQESDRDACLRVSMIMSNPPVHHYSSSKFFINTGFNGLTVTASNSLNTSGSSSVPLLSESAVALLEANAKAEESMMQKQKSEKTKKPSSSAPRVPPRRDENGKFISAKASGTTTSTNASSAT